MPLPQRRWAAPELCCLQGSPNSNLPAVRYHTSQFIIQAYSPTRLRLPKPRFRALVAPLAPNPYISIAHVHSLFGLPNVVDSPNV